MLAYRHAFHAGNAADVLKHAILAFCLAYLRQKEKGFLYVDTHAGAGQYDVNEQNKEWETGAARLFSAGAAENAPLLETYRAFISPSSPYPGSPALARKILRPQDRIVCYEKHPTDFALLSAFFADDRRVQTRNADGFAGLKSLLPPPTRRACVLIDPSYELRTDYTDAEIAVKDALKRFPTGVYLLWYPLLRLDDAGALLRDRLLAGYAGAGCYAELTTSAKDALSGTARGGLYGSGMLILNPPWTLDAALEASLPILARTLAPDAGGWRYERAV